MANMSPKKNPIPEQDPNVRNKNFEEVALGYTVEMAVDEANRCLNCPRPACMSGCPVNVKIPQFIARVREQDFKGAYHKILEDSSLPAICGRVCPQEKQCESKCVRGIKGEPVGIGRLERFVADWNRENADEMPEKIATNGHRVAVIGSGPSGLACASDLAKLGYDVTVYEHFHKAGGVLAYGIPEFRLPKAIVQKEIDKLVAMGVNIVCDATIGKCMSIDELLGKDADHLLGDDKYEAVFIGSGAGLPKFQNIPGLSYCGVFSANEFLTRINLMHAYDERYDTPLMPIHVTAVVGAGNVAMDAARCAKRLGADVTVVYRRGEEEIPARKEEYEHAKEEASTSTCCATRSRSWPMTKAGCAASSASVWSSASPTRRAAAVRSKCRAASLRWPATPSSWRWAPPPTRCCARRRRTSSTATAAASSSRTTP